MSSKKTLDLIDDIRNDALISMRENPNLNYQDAFKNAKKELIGDENILDFKFKPFNIEFDESLTINNIENNENDYYTEVKNELGKYINVNDFSNEQLDEFTIALKMGVDITKFADNKYSPKQLNFLCLLLSSGKSIDEYRNNYDFDPNLAIQKIINKEVKN